MSIAHALKWSFLSEVASKAISPVTLIVLARLLTPEDFGVVAAATMVISLSQVLWEGGMGRAIIQYRGIARDAPTTAFWINCALGATVALVLIACSGVLAEHVFHDPRVEAVLEAMSAQIVLGSLTSVQTALLQKEMNFKRLFWVRVVTVTLPGLIAIPFALGGFGYWALIIGALAGQASQTAFLWKASSWRPSLAFDTRTAAILWRFGVWVVASGLLTWLYTWTDSLVVSIYLGTHEFGLYRTGSYFVVTVYSLLLAPMLPVLYSHFSAIQRDRERVRATLLRTVQMVTYISIPSAFLIQAVAQPASTLAFGEQWNGIGQVISVMALTQGFAWIVGANGEAYRAIGRPDLETKVMAASLPLYVIAYLVSIRAGFSEFLWTRFGVIFLAIGIHLWVARVATGLPITATLLHTAKVSAVGIPLLVLGRSLQTIDQSPLPQTILVATSCGICAIGYLWYIERNSLIPRILDLLTGRKNAAATDIR